MAEKRSHRKKIKRNIPAKMMRERNQAAGASFFLLPQSSDRRPRALSALTANTLPSSPFHTYFMLFNAILLFWSFKARFKRARCWIIILKQRRGGGGFIKAGRSERAKATNMAFNCLSVGPFCRCHQLLSPAETSSVEQRPWLRPRTRFKCQSRGGGLPGHCPVKSANILPLI